MDEPKQEPAVVEPTPVEGAEPTPAEPTEPIASPEVKVEPKPAENVDGAKLQEQVNNLNIALKQEREASKNKVDSESFKKLEEELAESKGTIDRLGQVFNPVQEPAEEAPAEGLTKDQLEDFWNQKEEERVAKQKETEQASMIRTEITEMEKSWDGNEGKPKYDDDAVVAWQKENSKLHLTPKAAFYEMKHSEIVDYEVKQRLTKKPEVQNVETPGGVPGGRQPAETKPTTQLDLRAAVLEAMENSDADNNN